MVPDYSVIDARVCTYLEDHASDNLKAKAQETDDLKSRDFFASVGFILAALAAGSQCSAVKCHQRKKTTQDFGESCHIDHSGRVLTGPQFAERFTVYDYATSCFGQHWLFSRLTYSSSSSYRMSLNQIVLGHLVH